jgi:hypothetical protein
MQLSFGFAVVVCNKILVLIFAVFVQNNIMLIYMKLRITVADLIVEYHQIAISSSFRRPNGPKWSARRAAWLHVVGRHPARRRQPFGAPDRVIRHCGQTNPSVYSAFRSGWTKFIIRHSGHSVLRPWILRLVCYLLVITVSFFLTAGCALGEYFHDFRENIFPYSSFPVL